MSEEQASYIPEHEPPGLDDDGPIVTLSRHRYNVLLQCERTIRRLGIRDDDTAAQDVMAGMAMLQLLIGKDTVEPEGILARIERHLVRVFGMLDVLSAGQDANTAGLKDINDRLSELRKGADHEAQIGAARYQRLEKLLAFAEVDAPSLAKRLENIDVAFNAQTSAFVERFLRVERSLDLLVNVEQRMSNIERAIVAMIARS